MFLIELLSWFVDLVSNVWFAKRYGVGSLLWDAASFVCLVIAGVFFYFDLIVFGVLGILGTVICFICSIRCASRDIKSARQNQANNDERKNRTI